MSGVGMRMGNMMHLGRRIWRTEGHRGGICRTAEPLRKNMTGRGLDRRRLRLGLRLRLRELRYGRRVMKRVYHAHMVRCIMREEGVGVNRDYGGGRGLDEVIIIQVVWIVLDVIRRAEVIIGRSFLSSHFISSEETTTRTTRTTHSMFMA